MTTMGLTDGEQMEVMRIVAGILWLGTSKAVQSVYAINERYDRQCFLSKR
jgi:myosin heavy subunit